MKKPFKWDNNSDQPYQIRDRYYKKTEQKKHYFQHLIMLVNFIIIVPIALLLQFFLHSNKKCKIGLGVNLDKGDAQFTLVEELGVKNLIVRMPLWEIDKIDEYVTFIKGFGNDKTILINILQDREHIENSILLTKNIHLIFTKFMNVATEYQVGNAVNRSKWGFFSVGEYLNFYQTVQGVRDVQFPKLKLIGPSVIDFEYHFTTYALFNFKKLNFDKLSSLLYVDRRGSPNNTQYGFFNTKNKINLLYALAKLSSKTNNGIYITEVNWPLKDTQPFAPTSEHECVDEATYTQYMLDYFKIVKTSHKIERVYWHQLIAPGYGLVDNRGGKIRKTQAFDEFKKYMSLFNT